MTQLVRIQPSSVDSRLSRGLTPALPFPADQMAFKTGPKIDDLGQVQSFPQTRIRIFGLYPDPDLSNDRHPLSRYF